MKKYRWVIVVIGALVAIFGYWFFYLQDARENKLIIEGNAIVVKVEAFKKNNGYLPSSLQDIGITVKDEADPPIYYEKKGEDKYIVWFASSLDETKTYYSDSKHWEDFNRPMK